MFVVSVVAVMTAVEGAPVSFANLLTVVPVLLALAICWTSALEPMLRLPPSAALNVLLPLKVLLAFSSARFDTSDRSLLAGCVALGTPLVEMVLIHLWLTEAMDSMPPRVELDGLGKSAPTRARNVGAAAEPVEGPAKTRLAVWVWNEPVNVPEPVTGVPVTLNTAPGSESRSEEHTSVLQSRPHLVCRLL